MSVRKGLRFTPSTHRYYLDARPVPGVTTILGVLDKPALPRWSAKLVAEYVADNPDGIEQLRQMGRGPMVDALRGLPWQKRDDAASRGTTLHDHAEALLRGEAVELADDDPLLPVVENALRFLDEWHIEPVLIEAPVASREHRYAGTLDLIAKYRRPDTGAIGTAIFDWKSGKAIYPEFAWQLAAYAGAEFHGLLGDEHPIPATDAAFGIHIRPDGYDVYPLAHGPEVVAEFHAIRAVYDIAKQGRGDWRKPGSGHVGHAIHSTSGEES